jgi:hypothetical protein
MEADFCNAFWSVDDSGVDAVLTRLKAGSKALEDLRAFYKDRAAIEEDYAKRLLRLSRQHLGKDETGSMKAALERVRMETANIGDAHEKLAACVSLPLPSLPKLDGPRRMMKTSLEGKTKEFDAGRDARKRNPQASIEKLLKSKQQQELLVNKVTRNITSITSELTGQTGSRKVQGGLHFHQWLHRSNFLGSRERLGQGVGQVGQSPSYDSDQREGVQSLPQRFEGDHFHLEPRMEGLLRSGTGFGRGAAQLHSDLALGVRKWPQFHLRYRRRGERSCGPPRPRLTIWHTSSAKTSAKV